LFTTAEVHATEDALRWALYAGRIRRVRRAVYAVGPQAPTPLDRERAAVLRCGSGEARGALAGVLHRLDSVVLDGRPTRRDRLPPERVVVVGGVRCADGLATLIDLAALLDDLTWEQALESALRKRLTTIDAIEAELPRLSASRVPGTRRIRRVLALRPPGAPATESLLETLMVQLARDVPEVGELVRQHEVDDDDHGAFIARVDLARPDLGFFLELDGEHHEGQPVYDAMRQTAVVAATGMLPGRFTWTEVTRFPNTTKRRLAALARRARLSRAGTGVVPGELPGSNPGSAA
jgi:very-short-patch-repair endonuclease